MLQDLRYALRTLRATPGFTSVAILSLALAIGANTTIYSVVNELLLNDTTASNRDRLVRVGNAQSAFAGISFPNYQDLADSGVFKDLAAEIPMATFNWRAGAGSQRAFVQITSGNFFETLGVQATLGRTYRGAETKPETNPQVVVVSDGFWRRRLGADPNVLGRVLVLNDRPYTILGVLQHNYRSVIGLSIVPEIYAPASPALLGGAPKREERAFNLIGRLPDGKTREQTRAALAAQVSRLQQIYPATAKDLNDLTRFVALGGIERMIADPDTGRAFLTFFGILSLVVGLVLLIACANVSGLLLARGAARQREVAIRLAVGATRSRLIRQFLTEGFLLSLSGATLGLLINFWLTRLLTQVREPLPLPFEFTFAPDRGLLIYSVLLAAATAPLCALIPAFQSSRPDLIGALKQQQRLQFGRRFTLRNVLVAGQVALTMVMLVTAALFVRGTLTLMATNPGFNLDHTVSIEVIPVGGRFNADQFQVFRRRILDRIESVPGVVSATSAGFLPLNPETPAPKLRKQGDPESEARPVNAHFVGPRYFATMEIPVLSGRGFDISDRGHQPAPVIVNETFAHRYFHGDDALGQHLVQSDQSVPLEIVGIVRDSKIRTLSESPQPLVYRTDFSSRLIARTQGPPEATFTDIRKALGDVDATAAVEIRTLRDNSEVALWPTRVGAYLLGSLGTLGLFLALMGLYGVIAYAVTRRTSEIGIRMALGATRANVLWLILRDGLFVISIGAAIGLALAAAITRPLNAILPSATDPISYASMIVLLLVAGAAAALIPANRASRINPMNAM